MEEKVPAKISRLTELAYNIWWSWNPDARALFRRLDLTLWRSTQHNPVVLLQEISSERLEEAARVSGIAPVGRVPYDSSVTRAQIAGRTVIETFDGAASEAIRAIWETVANRVRTSLPAGSAGVVQLASS